MWAILSVMVAGIVFMLAFFVGLVREGLRHKAMLKRRSPVTARVGQPVEKISTTCRVLAFESAAKPHSVFTAAWAVQRAQGKG